MLELILRLDDKGRILIPVSVRKRLNIKNAVKMSIRDNKLVIEPIEDPLELLASAVVKGTKDIEKEITRLRKVSEKEVFKKVGERWS